MRQEPGQDSFEAEFCERAWQIIVQRNYDTHTSGLKQAARIVGEGERLLDVGCGRGEFAALALDRFNELHGVDISGTALKLAEAAGAITQRVNLNREPLPYPEGFFDAVVCLDLIEHLYEPMHMLQEIARVLKPAGWLAIQTFNIRYYRFIWSILCGHFPKTAGDDVKELGLDSYNYGHYCNFTFADLTELVERSGMRVTEKIGTGIPRGFFKMPLRLITALVPNRVRREFFAPGLMLGAVKE